VVHGEEQSVLGAVVRQAQQRGAQVGTVGDVEGTAGLLRRETQGLRLAGLGWQGGEVHPRQRPFVRRRRPGRRGQHPLERLAVHGFEDRAQRLVPPADLGQGALQHRHS
jgi:hypothetical protein